MGNWRKDVSYDLLVTNHHKLERHHQVPEDMRRIIVNPPLGPQLVCLCYRKMMVVIMVMMMVVMMVMMMVVGGSHGQSGCA